MKPSGIGGQAVMEGVMMKNKSEYAVAVRREDQSIVIKKDRYCSISEKLPFLKIPFVRGIVNFIESLYLGMKTLMYSASFWEEDEARKKAEWEEWISTGTGMNFTEKKKKRKKSRLAVRLGSIMEKTGMFFLVACSFVIAIALFMLFPMFLSEKLMGIGMSTKKAVLEGGLRLLIFFLYLLIISQMEDIKRVFMYHGAEHKTINCLENGLELTIENVRRQSRQHKRCGTSFLFLVIFLSIIFFIFIRTEILWQKIVFRLLLVPVIAAVSYEFIRLAGKSENPVVSFLSRPGMWFQNLTTREPEDDMIEVAIQSVEAVFDWREFWKEEGAKLQTEENMGIVKDAKTEESMGEDNVFEEETAVTKTLSVIAKERLRQTILNDEYQYRESVRGKNTGNDIQRVLLTDTEEESEPDSAGEDDAILKALDKYFGE